MMKRALLVAVVAIVLVGIATPSGHADPYSRGNDEHALRYLAYLAHPFGIAAEYLITRPIHWLVSRKHADVIFGHDPQEEDTYFVWH